MRMKAFICDVLARGFYHWAARSEHTVDIELLNSYYHEYPKSMNEILQQKIDELEEFKDQYDYILLGFGLCGNVVENLQSRSIPIVIPRAHDCITLFMGSKELYQEHFNENPGTMYYIESWLERNGLKKERRELDSIGLGRSYQELVEKYGEENAQYLMEIAGEWKSRYKNALYLFNDLTNLDYSEQVRELAQERNWNYDEIRSDFTIIKRMIFGHWNEEEFLTVKPYCSIYHTADRKIIDYECREEKEHNVV